MSKGGGTEIGSLMVVYERATEQLARKVFVNKVDEERGADGVKGA